MTTPHHGIPWKTMSSVLMTLIVKTLELEKDQILSSKFKTLT